MGVLLRAVFVTWVGPVAVAGLYHPVLRGIVKGVTVLVVYVLAVSLMDFTGLLHLTTGLVPGYTLGNLFRLLLELGLGLPMGGSRFGGLPPVDFGHKELLIREEAICLEDRTIH